MKRKLIWSGLLAVTLIVADLVRSSADNQWKTIHPGMIEQDVVAKIGLPTTNVVKSKGVQIWLRDGLIRSTSIAVFYYDLERPSTVTKTHEGTKWIWERL